MSLLVTLILLFVQFSASAKTLLVIDNVTIVSPHSKSILPARNIIISDGRISKITTASINEIPGESRINGEGLFLTPGQMDSHVHVSSIPGMGFGVDPVARNNTELVNFSAIYSIMNIEDTWKSVV